MKQRPNILVQKKSNTKLDYLTYLATENIQPNVSASVYITPKSKTKSKPNIKIKNRNIDVINAHRMDMMQTVITEKAINPDLLVEYPTYYILTITTYNIIQGVETPTAKDFDIYLDGVKLDTILYNINVNDNITITLQKDDEANVSIIDNGITENNFEIVGKFITK